VQPRGARRRPVRLSAPARALRRPAPRGRRLAAAAAWSRLSHPL